LHYQDHKTFLTTSESYQKLLFHHKGYKKGSFDTRLKNQLIEKKIKENNLDFKPLLF